MDPVQSDIEVQTMDPENDENDTRLSPPPTSEQFTPLSPRAASSVVPGTVANDKDTLHDIESPPVSVSISDTSTPVPAPFSPVGRSEQTGDVLTAINVSSSAQESSYREHDVPTLAIGSNNDAIELSPASSPAIQQPLQGRKRRLVIESDDEYEPPQNSSLPSYQAPQSQESGATQNTQSLHIKPSESPALSLSCVESNMSDVEGTSVQANIDEMTFEQEPDLEHEQMPAPTTFQKLPGRYYVDYVDVPPLSKLLKRKSAQLHGTGRKRKLSPAILFLKKPRTRTPSTSSDQSYEPSSPETPDPDVLPSVGWEDDDLPEPSSLLMESKDIGQTASSTTEQGAAGGPEERYSGDRREVKDSNSTKEKEMEIEKQITSHDSGPDKQSSESNRPLSMAIDHPDSSATVGGSVTSRSSSTQPIGITSTASASHGQTVPPTRAANIIRLSLGNKPAQSSISSSSSSDPLVGPSASRIKPKTPYASSATGTPFRRPNLLMSSMEKPSGSILGSGSRLATRPSIATRPSTAAMLEALKQKKLAMLARPQSTTHGTNSSQNLGGVGYSHLQQQRQQQQGRVPPSLQRHYLGGRPVRPPPVIVPVSSGTNEKTAESKPTISRIQMTFKQLD
ncbi:hypothetical protein BG004_002236 [Podila humilis]|nr:hypothetical protein BG004_002236 [Podila humilis]